MMLHVYIYVKTSVTCELVVVVTAIRTLNVFSPILSPFKPRIAAYTHTYIHIYKHELYFTSVRYKVKDKQTSATAGSTYSQNAYPFDVTEPGSRT